MTESDVDYKRRHDEWAQAVTTPAKPGAGNNFAVTFTRDGSSRIATITMDGKTKTVTRNLDGTIASISEWV